MTKRTLTIPLAENVLLGTCIFYFVITDVISALSLNTYIYFACHTVGPNVSFEILFCWGVNHSHPSSNFRMFGISDIKLSCKSNSEKLSDKPSCNSERPEFLLCRSDHDIVLLWPVHSSPTIKEAGVHISNWPVFLFLFWWYQITGNRHTYAQDRIAWTCARGSIPTEWETRAD